MFFTEKKIMNDFIWESSGIISKLKDGLGLIIGAGVGVLLKKKRTIGLMSFKYF